MDDLIAAARVWRVARYYHLRVSLVWLGHTRNVRRGGTSVTVDKAPVSAATGIGLVVAEWGGCPRDASRELGSDCGTVRSRSMSAC